MNKSIFTPATTVKDELHRIFMSCTARTEEEILSVIERLLPAEFVRLAEEVLTRMDENSSLQSLDSAIARNGGSSGIVTYYSILEYPYFYRIRFRRRPLNYACLEEMIGAMEIHHQKMGILITNARLSPDIANGDSIIPKNIKIIDGPKLAKLIIRVIMNPILP